MYFHWKPVRLLFDAFDLENNYNIIFAFVFGSFLAVLGGSYRISGFEFGSAVWIKSNQFTVILLQAL